MKIGRCVHWTSDLYILLYINRPITALPCLCHVRFFWRDLLECLGARTALKADRHAVARVLCSCVSPPEYMITPSRPATRRINLFHAFSPAEDHAYGTKVPLCPSSRICVINIKGRLEELHHSSFGQGALAINCRRVGLREPFTNRRAQIHSDRT